MLYDMTTRPEYEANIVAAEILIDNEGCWTTSIPIAILLNKSPWAMDTDINLVAFQKWAHLAELRIRFAACESYRSDFAVSSTGKEFLHEVQILRRPTQNLEWVSVDLPKQLPWRHA